MQKEGLFHWPTNFFSFVPDEVGGGNLPFPRYENGAIFLSWGEVALRAYAAYDPALAMKYVKKVLARYEQDGLSFQRYERRDQSGAGDDILAGNCMTIVGLYRDIYGLQPQYNRLYLAPHLTPELNGTQLRYQLRGRPYRVDLDTSGSAITAGDAPCARPRPLPSMPLTPESNISLATASSGHWRSHRPKPNPSQFKLRVGASIPTRRASGRNWHPRKEKQVTRWPICVPMPCTRWLLMGKPSRPCALTAWVSSISCRRIKPTYCKNWNCD